MSFYFYCTFISLILILASVSKSVCFSLFISVKSRTITQQQSVWFINNGMSDMIATSNAFNYVIWKLIFGPVLVKASFMYIIILCIIKLFYFRTWFSKRQAAVNCAPFVTFDVNCGLGVFYTSYVNCGSDIFCVWHVNCGSNNLYSLVNYNKGYFYKINFFRFVQCNCINIYMDKHFAVYVAYE